jgi:calcineurin-like phosphoesterase family protein
LECFEKLFGVHFWKHCILSHVPVHPGTMGSRALLNVHGHLHSKIVGSPYDPDNFGSSCEPDLNYFNVSIERHGLKPVNSSIIMNRLKEISG